MINPLEIHPVQGLIQDQILQVMIAALVQAQAKTAQAHKAAIPAQALTAQAHKAAVQVPVPVQARTVQHHRQDNLKELTTQPILTRTIF